MFFDFCVSISLLTYAMFSEVWSEKGSEHMKKSLRSLKIIDIGVIRYFDMPHDFL